MHTSLLVFLALGVASCVPSRDTAARQSPSAQPGGPRLGVTTLDPAPATTTGSTSATITPARLAPGSTSAAITPGPLLSRGRPVSGSSAARHANPGLAIDGDQSTAWMAGKPTSERPAWLAIDVGRGPERLLLAWRASGSFNHNETEYGSPGAYRIESSADSTDGEDGAWTTAIEVRSVTTHGAAHVFGFAGQRWVKLVVTGVPTPSPNGVQIDTVDVHDASAGAQDTWFFLGDSITAFAFGRSVPRGASFAERIHERHPRHDPAVINGGVGGDKTGDGLRHLDGWLAANPDVHFWGIGYGTNDAAGEGANPAQFETNLRLIVGRLLASGRQPILATIPHATDGSHPSIPRFNAVIATIRRDLALPPGPDLFAWFLAHPEELADGLHPNERGIASINRLWAAAVDPLYR